MDTDNGGWTVIQRRGKFPPQQDFYQNWQKYKTGFGNITGEFWLGNDYIYALTNQGPCKIRFDLEDAKGNRRFAVYKNFRIEDESSDYMLHVSGYSGNAGDGFKHHDGKKFSTKDRGNTGFARVLHGGFWHMDWAYVYLNGVYQPGKHEPKNIHWWEWLKNEGLAFTEMKVRLR
ncbi:Techylectin-5B like protein [Argiope bruennichi]|uniref:Techylectin-5B like protein n=1 Tax=Argiope bruennichi TaxID=94029 RepID=A0A8T0FCI9_ARGBR|nr:Techylectin-5B like protein [Argiope bruennichi]